MASLAIQSRHRNLGDGVGEGEMGHSEGGRAEQMPDPSLSVSTTTFTQITPPFPDLSPQTRVP